MERIIWETWCREAVGRDCFAEIKREPSNVTEALGRETLLKNIRRLNCDEKYKNDSASDFEILSEWIRLLPLCAGTAEAVIWQESLAVLGLDQCSEPTEIWRRGNEIVLTENKPWNGAFADRVDWCQFVSKNIERKKECGPELSDISSYLNQSIIFNKDKDIPIVFDASGLCFERPNPHLASMVLLKIIRDEKINSTEAFSLCSQLLIEFLLSHRDKGGFTLHFVDCEAARSLIAYLRDRRLWKGEIRLGIFLTANAECWVDFCDEINNSEGDLRVQPEVVLRLSDLGCDLENSLRCLISRYPFGGLRFGGVLTDSPLLAVAARRIFLNTLSDLLKI